MSFVPIASLYSGRPLGAASLSLGRPPRLAFSQEAFVLAELRLDPNDPSNARRLPFSLEDMMSRASASAFRLAMTLSGRGKHAQGIVHRLGSRKYFGNVAVQYNNVRAFREPLDVLAANASREIIVRPHLVGFTLFHNLLVPGGLPAAP
jgi:hypothetical protein